MKTNQTTGKPLIELSIHGESKIVTAGGAWLVNQHGDFSPACAEKINREHAALVAVAELMKNNAENRGCENFIKDGSYCDCFICKSREALAQLAAIQGGGK